MDFTGERLVPGESDLELEVEHLNRYNFASQFVKDKVILDVACGTGYGSKILSKNSDCIYGIDISEEAINYAKEHYNNKNLKFIVENLNNLSFNDNFFDIIVSFETIEHVDKDSQIKFLNEIKRTLKSDGLLIISTPNHDIYKKRGENKFHISEFSYEEFINFLNARFKYVKIFTQKFEVANIITSNDSYISNVKNKIIPKNSEYMIAVCSDVSLPAINSETNFYQDNKYSDLIKWSLNTHDLNEKCNKDFNTLTRKLEEKNDELMQKEKMIANFFEIINNENLTINEKGNFILPNGKEFNCKNDVIFDLLKKNQDLSNKNNTLDNENESLERQLATERTDLRKIKNELERVYNSRGHKMLNVLYKIEGFFIPPGSRRRFILKIFFKLLRHPGKYYKKINIKNFKNIYNLIIQGNIYSLNDDTNIVNDEKCTFIFDEVNESQTEFKKLEVPNCDMPIVSIIIPVYNQFCYTYNCIKAIINHTKGINYEIIVADDVSTDKTAEIEQIIENVKVIHNKKNLGFLLNCNNAAKFAKGKYIHFLNNDTYVQRNWLKSLLDLIESDTKIGLVGSKLVYPTGRLQEAGGIFWNEASAWNYGRGKDPLAPEYNYVKEVDYISGASIMISKKLWDKIGGFDEIYTPAYYEDSDLAFEVRKHGYKVVYQPESIVVHFEGMSNGKDVSTGIKSYQLENKNKFFNKWKSLLQNEHFKNGENVFLAKDRSRNKKCILFIDHYVPTFDKDAGSRATYQHLKLLVELGYNIKFIGDNFLKYEKYTNAIEQLGIEVLYGNKYATNWKSWVKENSKYINIVVLSRPHISKKYIDFIKKHTSAKIIYYVHDLHYLREFREYELTKNPKLKTSSDYWKKVEFNLMDKSNKIVTFSTDEKKIIDKNFPNKAAVVPIFIFDNFKKEKICFENRKDIMFIGGFKHKPNEDGVLWFVDKIWPSIEKEIPDCNFVILGSNPTDKIKKLSASRIKITGYVSDEQLHSYYRQCKVCVIPLRFGAGVKGKTVEAIYNKIPIVSTVIGIEGLIDADKYIEFTNNPDEFAKKVIKFYKNNEVLEKVTEKYDEYLSKYFSKDYAANILKKIF